MKRKMIVAGLMMLFFVALFGLTGCGLLSQARDANLTNAIGSENGPGSGNWKPQTPKNNRQARQIIDWLGTLELKSKEDANQYDKLYVQCLDENGKLLPDKSADDCIKPLAALATTLQNIYVDHEAGLKAYNVYYQENGAGSDLPSPKELIVYFPSHSPLENMDVQGWHGCLTCVLGIAPEHVFHPVEIALNQ